MRVDEVGASCRASGGAHEGGEEERQGEDEPGAAPQVAGDAVTVGDSEVPEP